MPTRLREKQWKAGRSAMELARAWVGSGEVVVPDEVQRLLETNSEWEGTELVEGRPVFGAEPETVGEPRYQLLHGVAGALIAADEHWASQALSLVHVFRERPTG